MLRIKTREIQDDDIENIAETRALDAAGKTNLPVIVEDAGLFVEALEGFPGPYSSYIYRTIGNEGILKLLDKTENRNSQFRSIVAFCDPQNLEKRVRCFIGIVNGRIAEMVRGKSGFGFDPIFEPLKTPNKTFGDMTEDEKNKLSHRSQALRKFAEWYRSI